MRRRPKIAELERLDREAKPGPWSWWQAESLTGGELDPPAGIVEYELICAMRTALPALLRVARAVKEYNLVWAFGPSKQGVEVLAAIQGLDWSPEGERRLTEPVEEKS